ncbi:MAG: cobalamin biosynthesis protein, partial [Lachnospiraceae bacterium]|nr:cobalamin biosynthesis protein [Lachnospiraceae bacterium]
TGTDNVCERAVVAAGCRLVAKKMSNAGITVAIGIRRTDKK